MPYETFRASDGDFVIAVGNDDQWRRFCAATGFAEDDRFTTNRQRVTNYDALKTNVDFIRNAPSADHLFGTDELGRAEHREHDQGQHREDEDP